MADENLKLKIQLIPRKAWNRNLRSVLSTEEWQNLRTRTLQRAGNKCEVCGNDKHLHCHEQWEFDPVTRTQKLVGLQAVCESCHAIIHFGRTEVQAAKTGTSVGELVKHFMRVNGVSKQHFIEHRESAYRHWRFLSTMEWRLDLRLLDSLRRVS